MISERDFNYLYDNIHVLYFGIWLDKTKVRLNLTRDNFAQIDKESYTKVPAHKEILENWDDWKKQKETLKFNEFYTRICPPGLKFEKEGNKLILSDEYCKRYQNMCLQNYDLNMKFISKLDKNEFNKAIDKAVKKYNMIEIKNLNECQKQTGLAKTSLTSMLDRMEKQDLIQKVENKEDGRSTIICLTEKSKALEKVYQKITDEMVIQYYNGFNEDEIRIFESTLERVVKNLEGTNNESSMELSGLEDLEVLQIY